MGWNLAKCPHICSQLWFSHPCSRGGIMSPTWSLRDAEGRAGAERCAQYPIPGRARGSQGDQAAKNEEQCRGRAEIHHLCPLRSFSVTKVTPCHCLEGTILYCSPLEQPEGLKV